MLNTPTWAMFAVCFGATIACGQTPSSRPEAESAAPKTGLRIDVEGQSKRFEAWRAIERKFAPPAEVADDGMVAIPVEIDPEVLKKYESRRTLPVIESYFEGMLPETVCFPDDRVQQLDTVSAPWSANCLLVITLSGSSQALGSGWLMGPRLIVTAGHCVHEGAGGGFFQSVEVIPGANGPLEPFGAKVSVTGALRASTGWKTGSSDALDYGAILLDAPFMSASGTSPARHAIAVKSDTSLTGASVRLSGYPGDKLLGTQWKDDDPISSILTDRLRYNLDTFGGQSGSAVLDVADSTAVGIHNYGGCPNQCTRITAAVKADLDAWLAESGGP